MLDDYEQTDLHISDMRWKDGKLQYGRLVTRFKNGVAVRQTVTWFNVHVEGEE